MKKYNHAQIFHTLSPLDGRYADKLADLTSLFSESQLNLTRLVIEIEWLKVLAKEPKISELKPLTKQDIKYLHSIILSFSHRDMAVIKKLETKTNHDIKALEYFLKKKLDQHPKLKFYREFIHFGCTSDDINNLSYAAIFNKAKTNILLPQMLQLINQLEQMALNHAHSPMLSRTHGQQATPTTFGKEMANFSYRLARQINYLINAPILGKFSGAVGNFNAVTVAYPEVDWEELARNFVHAFKLEWNPYTTQIEPHDWIAEHCDIIARFNTILIGLCRDIWGYISLGYLKQIPKKSETGSSVMPHKINPIDFENAEGNLGIANALLPHFSTKLPISRWQRDLSDSTVMRNLGVALGHTLLAYRSLETGLKKITVNAVQLNQELDEHWEVLAEAVQTVMRRFKIANSYEKLKKFTRGKKVTKELLHHFIQNLDIPKTAKNNLLNLSPGTYLGKASELAKTMEQLLEY